MKKTAGVILAGGLSRRMGGGDKSLLDLGGATILSRVRRRLSEQVEDLALNANGDPSRFRALELPVVPDTIDGFAGPLAGVLAGLDWAAEAGYDKIVTVAADTPFFPSDLVERLTAAAEAENDAPLACAQTQGRDHPTFGLWSVALREDLRTALAEEGLRKVVLWTERHGCARAEFPMVETTRGPLDPFFNVNTPDDMAEALTWLDAQQED
ncbi:MAG: molybdenum cofactor guanylyltransferase MobA [Pseudomonadota bacterium]|mgnify:CR=1 FL=1